MKLSTAENKLLEGIGNVHGGLWIGGLKRGFKAPATRLVEWKLLKMSRLGDLTITPAGRAALAEQKDRTNG